MAAKCVESATSNIGRAIVARIMPGIDLMEGIATICRNHDISSGCIVSGIGSLEQASFVYITPDPGARNNTAFTAPKTVDGPLELMSLQGTVGLTETHDISVHLHGMMINSTSRVCGGHLTPGGNPVLVTAEVMIYSTPDVSIVKTLDHMAGFELFNLK